jgi:hypothetical protein
MSDENVGRFQTTVPVMLVNPQLDEPKPYTDPKTKKASGEPKYTARLVLDPESEDFKTLKALVSAAAKAKHPGTPFADLAFPFKNGNAQIEKSKKALDVADKKYDGRLDYLSGKVFLDCRSQFPPLFAGIINGRLVDIASDEKAQIQKVFFPGALVYAVLKVNAYDAVGSNKAGVQVFLNEIMATGQGKRIASGSRSAAETFKGVAGKVTAEDPTAGSVGDDEIPF